MLNLHGIFPPIPTSFESNEDLAIGKFQNNLKKLSEHGLAGFLVLGSNGEKVMLAEAEKQQVFEAAREAIPKDKLMLAGTGEESTRATVQLSRIAAKAGADAVMVLNPAYYKGQMTKEALVSHYGAVADALSIPVIVYNMPACSGLDLTADVLVELSHHPNIIGMKDSGGNIPKMGEVMRNAEQGFQVLAGSASFLLAALSIGAVGGILASANLAPDLCIELLKQFNSGDLEKAREVQFKLYPINKAVTGSGGIAALKAAMDHLGLYGGPTRRPLLPIDEDQRAQLIGLLNDNQITL
jgi:4-hydroxy-2-oxoglutarate aldolase